MIPERLRLQAFGPYAGAIDLDFEALLSQGLFLVHGATGAGKTSILDAICYALFGEASGLERQVRELRSHHARPETPTEVCLDFRLGAERYRIVRRPEQPRPKRRGGGTTPTRPTAKLYRRTGMAASDHDTVGPAIAVHTRKVDAAIERLLGFSATQFRQVVLLPQGRFRELLTAGSKERERVLEALFDTAQYREVEEALKDAARKARETLRELRARREALLRQTGAEDEANLAAEIATLDERAKALLADRARLDKHAKQALAALEQGRVAAERHRNVDEVARELEALTRQAPRMHAARKELEDALRALPFEAFAAEADRLHVEVRKARERLQLATDQLAQAQAQAATEAARAELTERLGTIKLRLDALREQRRLQRALAQVARRRDAAVAGKAVALADVEQAESALEQATLALREHQALALAQGLRPGAPCPVCGSSDHPVPASPAPPGGDSAGSPSTPGPHPVDLAASHRRVRALRQALVGHERTLVQMQAEHASVADQLARAQACVPTTSDAGAREAGAHAVKELIAELSDQHAALVEKVEGPPPSDDEGGSQAKLEEATRRVASTQAALEAATADLGRAQVRLQESAARNAAALRAAGFESPPALEAARRSKNAVALLTADVRRHEEALSLARARAARAEERARDVARPDLAALAREANVRAEQVLGSVRQHARLEEQRRLLVRVADELGSTRKELGVADKRYGGLSRLASVAGGRNGAGVTFQRYVLASLLDRVLVLASRRLATMTRGRYTLERRDEDRADQRAAGGLDLYVADGFTGVSRPAATLSGGESFLAALALALGLADVVQSDAGGVQLGALFVDEGFGSLDPEALDAALSVLRELEQQGRRVGVVSHVPELERRIPTRLEVLGSPTGSLARVHLGTGARSTPPLDRSRSEAKTLQPMP